MAATDTITLSDYAELFDTRALELLRRGQPLDYQHTVATTWSLALERLRERSRPRSTCSRWRAFWPLTIYPCRC